MGNSFDKNRCASDLRQSQARINIHRSKKLSGIAKKKDDICKHLEAGNEVNAKIWAETLINEEGMIPVYDVVSTMCDQVNGRMTQIAKFGPPKDMNQTFATIIHAAPKIDVDELLSVRKQLAAVLDKQFVQEADSNYDMINPVVAQNIDFKKPEDGEVILRLCNIAKERNIDYKPTHQATEACHAYCIRKNIPPPPQVGPDGAPPVYNPSPLPPVSFDPQMPSVPSQNPIGQPPVYQPQAPPMVPMMPPQPSPVQPPIYQPSQPLPPQPQPPMQPQQPYGIDPQNQMPPAYQPGYDPQTMIGTPVNDTDNNKKGGDDDQPPAGGAAAAGGAAGGDLDDIQARINALKGL